MSAYPDQEDIAPAHDGPRYELHNVGRVLADLAPAEQVAPRPGGEIRPLIYSAVSFFALLAFLGWLLVSR